LVTLIIHMNKDQTEMILREWEEALESFHFHHGNGVPSVQTIRR